jgi:hypothetical protein
MNLLITMPSCITATAPVETIRVCELVHCYPRILGTPLAAVLCLRFVRKIRESEHDRTPRKKVRLHFNTPSVATSAPIGHLWPHHRAAAEPSQAIAA